MKKGTKHSNSSRKKMSDYRKKMYGNPQERQKHQQLMKLVHETPEAKQRQSEAQKKRFSDPDNRSKHKDQMKKITENPKTQTKISETMKRWWELHPEAKLEKSKFMKQYFIEHPESLEKIKVSSIDRFASTESRKKASDATKQQYLDRCWYGSVTYNDRPKYCILFNKEFKERCRAFYGYKSVLSGKTMMEQSKNKGKPINLTVHHVYYQPKACCEWDKDIQGYYVMINLGTKHKQNIVRYNIRGDPNKFVILTNTENSRVNFNKSEWIKYFENLIEINDGKCYFTKKEMENRKELQKVQSLYITGNEQSITKVGV